jgi:hypothetical protein
MKTQRHVLIAAVAVSFIASGGLPARAAAAKPTHAQAPAGLVVVQEDVLIPLIDEPQAYFRQASKDYAQGDQAGAARQMRAAGALIRLEAGRHDAANKAGLDRAAKRLDDLAAQMKAGKVKSAEPMNQAFAAADLALARHYHEMALRAAGERDRRSGSWLKGAADSVEDAAKWSGGQVSAGFKAGVDGARALGNKIASGAEWSADEVRATADALGHDIGSVGRSGQSSSGAAASASGANAK